MPTTSQKITMTALFSIVGLIASATAYQPPGPGGDTNINLEPSTISNAECITANCSSLVSTKEDPNGDRIDNCAYSAMNGCAGLCVKCNGANPSGYLDICRYVEIEANCEPTGSNATFTCGIPVVYLCTANGDGSLGSC